MGFLLQFDLQKLLKYFNGITIFVFFIKIFSLLSSSVFATRATLYLNDWESLIVKSALLTEGSFLLSCHKLPDVSE